MRTCTQRPPTIAHDTTEMVGLASLKQSMRTRTTEDPVLGACDSFLVPSVFRDYFMCTVLRRLTKFMGSRLCQVQETRTNKLPVPTETWTLASAHKTYIPVPTFLLQKKMQHTRASLNNTSVKTPMAASPEPLGMPMNTRGAGKAIGAKAKPQASSRSKRFLSWYLRTS